MTDHTFTWWSFLCTIAALNVLAWCVSAALLRRQWQAGLLAPDVWRSRRLQLLLCAGYVLGCAYRSVLPVYDVQRLVMVDSWASSVIVGRSVATIAELCFAAQWALLLHGVSQAAGSRLGLAVSRLLVPLIVVAETCSWFAVLTTANIGHVIEESIWGLCAALLVVSLAALWPRSPRGLRPVLALCAVAGVVYAAYMFGVDVPMYWARWVADQAQDRTYLGLHQGLLDASSRWVVSHRWDDWKSEVVWMSLYFSAAVWLSIGLAHVPAWHRQAQPRPLRARRPGPRLRAAAGAAARSYL